MRLEAENPSAHMVRLGAKTESEGLAAPTWRFAETEAIAGPYSVVNPYLNSRRKRAFDVVVTCAALIVSIPLFMIIAGILQLSGQPVFFKHERIGKAGIPFLCLKFHTMVPNAEQLLPEVLTNPALRQEWETEWKLRNDPRVTRIGWFLRQTSVDELPQLLNVLRGDMSLVGARPIVPDQQGIYGPVLACYKQCRPGLTGLWQVSGRSTIGFSQQSGYDFEYFRTASLWLDIVILARTAAAVVSWQGAL